MARKQIESICVNCGFEIVTDYPYHPTCPICGQPLINRKPVAQAVVNKKSKGAKKNGRTEKEQVW